MSLVVYVKKVAQDVKVRTRYEDIRDAEKWRVDSADEIHVTIFLHSGICHILRSLLGLDICYSLL